MWRSQESSDGRGFVRGIVTACVVAILLLATIVVAGLTLEHDIEEADETGVQHAEQAAAALRSTIGATTSRLEDAAALLSAERGESGRALRAETWEGLRSRLFEQSALFGVGFARVVLDSERAEAERALGAVFKEPGPGGTLRPASRRERYAIPVLAASRDGSSARLGVDLAAERERRTTLTRAVWSGEAQVTAPVTLIGAGGQGIVAYAPVYTAPETPPTPAGRADALVGFMIGSYRTAALVAEVESILGPEVEFAISEGGRPFAGSAALDDPITRSVSLGGRRLDVAVAGAAPDLTGVVLVAGAGGTVTMLVALVLLGAARRERDAVATGENEARRRERAETQFVAAFDQAPIGMAIVALDGCITRVNDALSSLTGYPRDVLVGRALADIVHPEDAPDVRRLASELGDHSMASEQRLLSSDGTVRWAATTVTVMHDDDSAPDALLVQVQDITERRAYEQRLQHLANHDPLTGLLNRRAFGEELDRQAAHVERYGDRGAVLMLDLDHFKAVNDTLGHSAGDRLIIEVAHRLKSRLRDSDVLARLGGDEFAVLLPEADAEEATVVAEALLEVVRGTTVPHRPRSRPITASIGLTPISRGGGDRVVGEDLLVRADLALYDAKDAGRDRTVVYAAGPHEIARTEARLSWIQRLHEALDTGSLTLHYQPIVDLATGRTAAVEALVRLRQPDGDLVAPSAFLPIAERYGLAPRLDRWVLERAVLDLATLHADDRDVVMSVNVSAHSIADPAFLADMERILTADGAAPGHILVELTETAAVKDIPQAQAFARRLRELGGRLALDDFGAGFGSFYYLKHLPFDVLKIDGEFVRSATSAALDRDIVRAIVEIARGAGSLTVAEHVGSQATVEQIHALGVDLGQGFHLGHPMPLEALRARLADEAAAIGCDAQSAAATPDLSAGPRDR